MPLTATSPTLSWIEAFTTAHLSELAADFTAKAELWESLKQLASDTSRPGGHVWTGPAADTAQDNAEAAGVTAWGAASKLRDAAGIAVLGADQLDGLQAKSLEAIGEARADGFQVNENLSVTDTRRQPWGSSAYAVRQALADEHAEYTQFHAGQLLALDNEYGAKLLAATDGLDTLALDAPGGDTPPANEHNGIQLVNGHTFKQSPIPEPGPNPSVGGSGGPSAADIRGVLDKLPQGTNPNIREVRSQADLGRLWTWLEQHGVERPGGYGPKPGVQKQLPDGTIVGRRDAANSTQKPALDINIPGEKGNIKVHINPERGGVPEIPASVKPSPSEPAPKTGPGEPAPRAAPAEGPVRGSAPVEAPPVRGGPVGGLPLGGAVPDGSMPHLVDPPGPEAGGPDLPVIGDGNPDVPEA